MTEKEKRSLKVRLGRRLSSDRPEVMEIVREEINKTPTTPDRRQAERRSRMRLIDADALKKALHSNCELCHDKNTNWCERCCPLNDFEDLIDNAPTVTAKGGET